jgi:hypothetical protein
VQLLELSVFGGCFLRMNIDQDSGDKDKKPRDWENDEMSI